MLIDQNGEKLGEQPIFEALKLARENNLDLVEISPHNNPPVCRIMDYGKFKYDQAKKDKKNQQNRKESELKEIRLSANIDQHDLDFKAKRALEFIEKGHLVRVNMRLVGRENIFVDRALGVFREFADMINMTYESNPRKQGNRIEANLIKPKVKENAQIKNP